MKAELLCRILPSRSDSNDLIEACRKGDHKAQLQVYKLYYKPVYNFYLRILKDPVEAEERMHESFLRAFENISLYRPDISFAMWLNNYIVFSSDELS